MAEFARRIAASRFLRFALVGTGGFVVDEAVLAIATRLIHLDPYSGRAISFFCAVTFTWWGNRTITFQEHASTGFRDTLHEWARFVATNAFGAIVNYMTYAVLIRWTPWPLSNPYVALAIGVLAGMV
ncbi:MAG TPA: GtrA family protein, partial [Sphingomicrobium sp.]